MEIRAGRLDLSSLMETSASITFLISTVISSYLICGVA
jgi:hypothetical protein